MSEPWFHITNQNWVLRIHHQRAARDQREAHEVLAAVDAQLEGTGIELLMFDSRDADRTPPDVAAVIWGWLQERPQLRKVATLMHSRELARSARRTGADSGILFKTFDDEGAARRWLLER